MLVGPYIVCDAFEDCEVVPESHNEWRERRRKRVEKYGLLRRAGLLERKCEDLRSLEEITDFIGVAYWVQKHEGSPFPLNAAELEALIEQAIRIAGDAGITSSRLEKALSPLSKPRLQEARRRLEVDGVIRRTTEMLVDRRGVLRPQTVWHHRTSTPSGHTTPGHEASH